MVDDARPASSGATQRKSDMRARITTSSMSLWSHNNVQANALWFVHACSDLLWGQPSHGVDYLLHQQKTPSHSYTHHNYIMRICAVPPCYLIATMILESLTMTLQRQSGWYCGLEPIHLLWSRHLVHISDMLYWGCFCTIGSRSCWGWQLV